MKNFFNNKSNIINKYITSKQNIRGTFFGNYYNINLNLSSFQIFKK